MLDRREDELRARRGRAPRAPPPGVNQPRSTHSPPSGVASAPSGARGDEEARVEADVDLRAGVIQRENGTSACGVDAARCRPPPRARGPPRPVGVSPSPSCASTAPPGKTQAPPMKRASALRCTSSTSASRRRRAGGSREAACRGTVGLARVLRSSPGPGRSTSTPGNLVLVEREVLLARAADRAEPVVRDVLERGAGRDPAVGVALGAGRR